MTKRMIVAVLLIAAAGLVLTSCVVGVRAHPVPVGVVVGPPVEYGYQPLLYDGYVVYYTDDGIPFYWAGGVRVWVPIEFRAHYISHWRTHRHAYHTWYTHRGSHYRSRSYRSHQRGVRRGPGHQPVIKPKHHRDGRPVIKPKDKKESKPVIKPKKKKKPVIKPK